MKVDIRKIAERYNDEEPFYISASAPFKQGRLAQWRELPDKAKEKIVLHLLVETDRLSSEIARLQSIIEKMKGEKYGFKAY
jgi:hypothetical protein